MSQRTWDLVSHRKELKLQINANGDQQLDAELQAEYRRTRCSIKKSVRQDKRTWVNGIAEMAQRAADTHNTKDLYNATKTLAGKARSGSKPIRSKDGQMIVTSSGQLQRWHEHFTEVFQLPTSHQDSDNPTSALENNDALLKISTHPPSKAEVLKAIKSLKDGKAPGLDLISAEMLKADSTTSADGEALLTPFVPERDHRN